MNKKPRMRTADDVISRVLWDPSVDASDFVVGYVDRFLGVLERPFNDFNWDTDPCDCDYSAELALPRHRIQYFTYRGHRVWDRHTRTDRVFGSTGQSLAPPFGREEEVTGMREPSVSTQLYFRCTKLMKSSACCQVSSYSVLSFLLHELTQISKSSNQMIKQLSSRLQSPDRKRARLGSVLRPRTQTWRRR